MLHAEEKPSAMFGLSPDTWRIVGYVRDIVIISGKGRQLRRPYYRQQRPLS